MAEDSGTQGWGHFHPAPAYRRHQGPPLIAPSWDIPPFSPLTLPMGSPEDPGQGNSSTGGEHSPGWGNCRGEYPNLGKLPP